MSTSDDRVKAYDRIAWGLFLLAPHALLSGWVLSLVWKWFVAPLGIPTIGVFHAVGLSLAIQLFIAKSTQSEEKRHPLEIFATSSALMLTIMGMSWLVHLLMQG